MELIPLEDLIIGKIYKTDARNIEFGLYNGDGSFLGLRVKFNSTFIDEEIHFDKHRIYGTVKKMEETEFSFRLQELNESDPHYEKELFNYLITIYDTLCTE